jgi:hypothetical protein
MTHSNFWRTVEVDAWSRNFDYEEYLEIHHKACVTGQPLTCDGYYHFCVLMDDETEDFK